MWYEDAIICHQKLDLNWMGPVSKLHVGIPYQSCARYSKKLVDLGYRVCVVDQIEDDSDDEEQEEDELEAKVANSKRAMSQGI